VLAFGVFIAFDDFFLRHFLKAPVGLNALLVFDAFAALTVDHAEGDGAFSAHCREKIHGTRTSDRRRLPDQKGMGAMRYWHATVRHLIESGLSANERK
jgi:hypothetical protein